MVFVSLCCQGMYALIDSNPCQVRVDVSARNPGKVQAALTETRRGLNELVLEPLKEEEYYEVDYTFLLKEEEQSCFCLLISLNYYCFANWNFISLADKRTLFHNVSREKSDGSDGGIYADCCVSDAKIDGEHG